MGLSQKPMDLAEKVLYHQIHPAKVSTDAIVTIPSLYLFWLHELVLGIIVSLAPAIVASALIIRFVNLEKYKASALGHYVERYMTRKMQTLRLAGFIVMAIGAWFADFALLLVPLGVVIILVGWSWGKIFPNSRPRLVH